MITTMPNVDRKQMPELARFVEQCMMRYEYRLDGSSLWEGRVLVPPVLPRDDSAVAEHQ